jgi:hypothetical protein
MDVNQKAVVLLFDLFQSHQSVRDILGLYNHGEAKHLRRLIYL